MPVSLHAYYPKSEQMGAYGVLCMIGRQDLIAPTEAIMRTKLGPRTLREHNAAFRNTVIAHPSYRAGTIERDVFGPLDLDDPEIGPLYQDLMAQLFTKTLELRVLLRGLYPKAMPL